MALLSGGVAMTKIYPIVIFPFTYPPDERHLRQLYDQLRRLNGVEPYQRPLTIINSQTWYRNTSHAWGSESGNRFGTFITDVVDKWSDKSVVWSTDTCQMWLGGLGEKYDSAVAQGDHAGVFWLIPGDFDYDTPEGIEILEKIDRVPLCVRENNADFCVGEITSPENTSKQLIDTYGTYGLLYNWFPEEAKIVRKLTSKPRTEFFAISQAYLTHMLNCRWFPYEQTLIMLLEGLSGTRELRSFYKEPLGSIHDQPQGRDTLFAAMQQVERAERVLKLYWRERNLGTHNWLKKFQRLDVQSGQIRSSAFVILQQQLL